MKKLLTVLLVLVSVFSVFAGGQGEGSGVEEMRFATASLGGAYFPMGQGISNLVTEYAEGLTMVPIASEGAVQNPRLIDSKDAEFGITNMGLSRSAANGVGPYSEGLAIAGVASLYPSVLHGFVLKNSSITSISQLKGKRVAVGPAGGGTITMLTKLLEAYGMTMDDLTPSYLSYTDGFSQLSDGNVDAAFALSGYPASAVMQTIATHSIKAINIEDKIDDVIAGTPVYTRVVVPADVYDLDSDAVLLGQQNILITQKDMSDEIVYSVLEALFDHLPEFASTNANAKLISREQAPDIVIPLHPGAEKYYSEN